MNFAPGLSTSLRHIGCSGCFRAWATNQERLNARREYAGPEFLKKGFRPLCLGAGLWAALAVPLWVAVWTGRISYNGIFDPATWHVHEMLFGFVAAAVGGFILTAVPNWTGRLPVRGKPLGLLAALAVWVADGAGVAAVGGLVAAGILHLARLSRWRGWQTTGESLVTILHVGYFWAGIGLVLLGLSMLVDTVPRTAALHVLTLGAMGTMILAVMTRAILGHTGRTLTAGSGTLGIYVLVTVALFFRLANEIMAMPELVWLSALAWSSEFGLFV
jgi:uncharacterized protein involved in response to NO